MVRGLLRLGVGLGSEPDEGARTWPLWPCRSTPAPHRLKAGLQTEFSTRLLDNHYSLSGQFAHGQEFVWRQDGDFAAGVIRGLHPQLPYFFCNSSLKTARSSKSAGNFTAPCNASVSGVRPAWLSCQLHAITRN